MHDAFKYKLHIQFTLNTRLYYQFVVSPMLNSHQSF